MVALQPIEKDYTHSDRLGEEHSDEILKTARKWQKLDLISFLERIMDLETA